MTFDPQSFLNDQSVDGKLETQFTPIPAREYIALIQKIEARQMAKTSEPGEWTVADFTLAIDDAAAKEATGLANPTLRDSVFLDIDPATNKLAQGKNKNIALGRYLEATGLNGQVGNPFQMLLGKMVKIQVVVEPDKKNAQNVYARVKAVGKA